MAAIVGSHWWLYLLAGLAVFEGNRWSRIGFGLVLLCRDDADDGCLPYRHQRRFIAGLPSAKGRVASPLFGADDCAHGVYPNSFDVLV